MTQPSLEDLTRELVDRGIDLSRPGFYDDPRFREAEKGDPTFLEKYAAFVGARDYDAQYEEAARRDIQVVAGILHDELATDGRLGACVDIGMMLSRILEQEGYWNYLVKGSLTVSFPPPSGIKRKFFWSYDLIPSGTQGFTAAHAWMVAPPYAVVDIALRQQPYTEGRDLIPATVLVEDLDPADATIDDVFSPEFIAFAEHHDQVPKVLVPRFAAPRWRDFMRVFPAGQLTSNGLRLKYCPVGIGAPDSPFKQMDHWRVNGRLAREVYRELVMPALKESRRRGD